MNVSDFTRKAIEAGDQDPDLIAKKYLAEALVSDDPAGWLLVPVRMAVGSAFSSIQKALRGEQRNGGAQIRNDGTGIQSRHDDQRRNGSGDVITDLTRQAHTESQLWVPSIRQWILFADATVEQIESTITYYQGRKKEISQSIAELRKAIRDIRSVPGAACLRDVWAAREKTA